MKFTAGTFGILVAYRQDGVQYGNSGEAEGNLAPFDQVEVKPGETFELPENSRLIFAREMTPIAAVDVNVYALA